MLIRISLCNMDIFRDITYEVTLNLEELRKHPGTATKLQYLATDHDINLYKIGSEFRIRAPRQSFKHFQSIFLHTCSIDGQSSILVRCFEQEENVLDLLKGGTWGKASGEDIMSFYPTVTLPCFALYMSQNYQFVVDKLRKHQSSVKVKTIEANYVTFSLTGPASQIFALEVYLRDQYKTVRQTFEVFDFEVLKVVNREQFLDLVFDQLKPIMAIMVGNYLSIIFPFGEIEDNSQLKEVVEICRANSKSLRGNNPNSQEKYEETDEDIESTLKEIWIVKGMKTEIELQHAAFEPNQEEESPTKDCLHNTHIKMKERGESEFTEISNESILPEPEKGKEIIGVWKEEEDKLIVGEERDNKATDNKAVFIHTASKGRVICSVADITKLEVDCIVNAASRDLGNHGGVAKAIAVAAGSSLDIECKRSFVEFGPMQVAEVRTTTAGKLPCKKVLHTLGPWWGRDNHMCVEQLQYAVNNCLSSAEDMKMKSIAIPAISAGKFGVPMFHVAQATSSAINTFCTLHSDKEQGYLKEIYLVDPGWDAVSAFESAFAPYVKDGVFTKAEHK